MASSKRVFFVLFGFSACTPVRTNFEGRFSDLKCSVSGLKKHRNAGINQKYTGNMKSFDPSPRPLNNISRRWKNHSNRSNGIAAQTSIFIAFRFLWMYRVESGMWMYQSSNELNACDHARSGDHTLPVRRDTTRNLYRERYVMVVRIRIARAES